MSVLYGCRIYCDIVGCYFYSGASSIWVIKIQWCPNITRSKPYFIGWYVRKCIFLQSRVKSSCGSSTERDFYVHSVLVILFQITMVSLVSQVCYIPFTVVVSIDWESHAKSLHAILSFADSNSIFLFSVLSSFFWLFNV